MAQASVAPSAARAGTSASTAKSIAAAVGELERGSGGDELERGISSGGDERDRVERSGGG
jgi:hypothetical protein